VLPFPIRTNKNSNKYIFIQPEKEVLVIDTTKQYYVRLNREELAHCKIMQEASWMCRQDFPLQIIQSFKECEVQMLQSIREIPKSCSQRIIELKETLWIPLKGNVWTFVAPEPDQLTIIYQGQEPFDVKIKENGKITFYKRLYRLWIANINQIFYRRNVNNTDKYVIPPLTLTMECCESESNKLKLDAISIKTPIMNILTHTDELKLASHKVDDLEKLIRGQEWKLTQNAKTHQLSIIAYTASLTLGLLMCILLCCCWCKCCRNWGLKSLRACKECNRCTAIIFKPRIATNVHASDDDVSNKDVRLKLVTSRTSWDTHDPVNQS
jgi:hypothetical protein